MDINRNKNVLEYLQNTNVQMQSNMRDYFIIIKVLFLLVSGKINHIFLMGCQKYDYAIQWKKSMIAIATLRCARSLLMTTNNKYLN